MSGARVARALALVGLVASAVACGSSNNSMPTVPTTTGTAANVVITINGMNATSSYTPSPTTVPAGQSVAWRNADSISHTATQDAGVFDTGPIPPGSTSAPVTLAAGTYTYHCSIHPTMVGVLTVQ